MNWLSKYARRFYRAKVGSRRRSSTGRRGLAQVQCRGGRLALETLEDRLVPSVTVTNALDTPIANLLSLREAVTMVDAGQVPDNTIILPAGIYLNSTGALNVTHSLTLQGAGAANTIIDGGGTDRVFVIHTGAAVTIQFSGVTIRNGITSGNGGGIDLLDAAGQSSSLTLMNSIVTGNTADSGNGNQYEYGGGIALNNASLTLKNTQVTGNQLPGSNDFGGGIGVGLASGLNGSGSITITNSSVIGNTAGFFGGGIAIQDAGVTSVSVTGSTISDNTLTAADGFGGGGVFVNTSGAVSISNTVISGNTSGGDGGGFASNFGNPSSITLSGDTVTDNRSSNGNGGGIAFNTYSLTTVQGCTITDNSAFMSGGGLSASNNFNTTITGSTVTDNMAAGTSNMTLTRGGGGGLSFVGGAVGISNSTIGNNVASTGPGGGLLVTSTSVSLTTINTSWFGGNIAATNGGAFCSENNASMVVSGSTFDNNLAGNSSGGAIDNAGQNVSLYYDTFQANSVEGANGSGGALYSGSAGAVTVLNCLVLDNIATIGGGGFYQVNGSLSISRSQFTGNVATVDGGALYVLDAAFTATASTFNGNQALQDGGALFYDVLGGNESLTNDTFTANTAVGAGGAIYVAQGSPSFVNDTVNGNTAATSFGGGIAIFSTGVTFQNTLVVQDAAQSNFDGPDIYITAGDAVTDKGGNYVQSLAASGNSGFGPFSPGNPNLGPLEDNGQNINALASSAGAPGSSQVVQTEALLPGSLAIGAGVAANAPSVDERGFPSPGAAGVSIGAYEPQYNASATPNQIFVENVYEVYLYRVADSGGLANWTGQLQQGVSRTAVVAAIEGSSEYENDLVLKLYERYLHRAPDPGGLQTFVGMLAGGSTIEQVSAALMGSTEYFNLHGGNNLGSVDAMYEDALNRLPDPAGLNTFLQDLATGTSQAAAAAMLFSSLEYQNDVVEANYQALLGRQADTSGLAYFLNLLGSGTTDQALAADILGSTEAFGKRT